ncbi:hypothetical protein ONZ45_g10755 [Pleurotus djamor]|nr:hypothetical protein ONZ45_g10755 [Pleurotus djamor]
MTSMINPSVVTPVVAASTLQVPVLGEHDIMDIRSTDNASVLRSLSAIIAAQDRAKTLQSTPASGVSPVGPASTTSVAPPTSTSNAAAPARSPSTTNGSNNVGGMYRTHLPCNCRLQPCMFNPPVSPGAPGQAAYDPQQYQAFIRVYQERLAQLHRASNNAGAPQTQRLPSTSTTTRPPVAPTTSSPAVDVATRFDRLEKQLELLTAIVTQGVPNSENTQVTELTARFDRLEKRLEVLVQDQVNGLNARFDRLEQRVEELSNNGASADCVIVQHEEFN